jgi:hypothetical protein
MISSCGTEGTSPMAGNDIRPADDHYPARNRDAPDGLPRRLPVPWPRAASKPSEPGEPAVGSDVLARVRTALLRM